MQMNLENMMLRPQSVRFWNREEPVGLPGTGALLSPRLLLAGNKLQPPEPSLSSKGQVQTVADQGRQGMQTRGSSHKRAASGQGPGTHTAVSFSSTAEDPQ